MKRRLSLFVIILEIIFLTLFSGCSTQQQTAVAMIDGEKISEAEFNIYLIEAKQMFEEIGGDDIWETDFEGKTAEEVAKESALNSIFYIKISAKAAKNMNISLTKEEKEQALKEAQNSMKALTEQELEEMNLTEDIFIRVMEEKILRNKLYESITGNFELSEKDFESYYVEYMEENKKELIQLDIEYIYFATYSLVNNKPVQFSEEEKKKVQDKALLALKNIRETKEMQSNECDEKVSEIISAGEFDYKELEEAAFSLDEGEISDLIQTAGGYYIIKLNEKRIPNEETIKQNLKETYINSKKNEIFNEEFQKWSNGISMEKYTEVWNTIKIVK